MGVTDAIKPLFEWIDVYGQWFCVTIVYAWELFCLPIAACLLVVFYLKGRTREPSGGWGTRRLLPAVSYLTGSVWRIIFLVLLFTVIAYLLLYRMHWYSPIAWPVMLLAFCFVLSRWKWWRITDVLLHPVGSLKLLRDGAGQVASFIIRKLGPACYKVPAYVRHPSSVVADLRTSVGRLQPRTRWAWLKGAGIIVGIWMLWSFLSVPSDLFVLLLIVTTCVAASGLAMVKIGNCERELDKYLRSDPRMTLYLDAVRRIRAKGTPEVFLCSDRLKDPDLRAPGINLWTILFRVSLILPARWVLRFLACREWMPTINSAFILQRVEQVRQETWRRYASARFGRFEGEPAGNPLDAYLGRIDEGDKQSHPPEQNDHPGCDVRRKPSEGPRHPPEFDNDHLRQLRITWLALTEALAECHVFGACRKGTEEQASRNLLKAAELLGQAGEVQHQFIHDLARYEETHKPGKNLKKEVGLALHLLNLSARCVEEWLARREPSRARNPALYDRYERFCGPILDGKSFAGDLLEHGLRRILLMRYRLMAHLELLRSPEDEGSNSILSEENKEPGAEPSQEPQDPGLAFETAMAQLAYFGAFTSLCIQRRKGNQARFPWLPNRPDRRVPPLTVLGARIGRALRLAQACGEPEYRVKNGDRHIRQLAGMAIEQEMEYLDEGTTVRSELCRLAAGLYDSCGYSRIRLIWAMARTAAWHGPGAPSGEHSSRPDDITEMNY